MDDRSAIAVAAQWATTVITISVEMVLPGVFGYWVDQKLGTRLLFLVLGAAGGMALAMWQLLRLSRNASPPRRGRRPGK